MRLSEAAMRAAEGILDLLGKRVDTGWVIGGDAESETYRFVKRSLSGGSEYVAIIDLIDQAIDAATKADVQ